jgi:hypothetical protein
MSALLSFLTDDPAVKKIYFSLYFNVDEICPSVMSGLCQMLSPVGHVASGGMSAVHNGPGGRYTLRQIAGLRD